MDVRTVDPTARGAWVDVPKGALHARAPESTLGGAARAAWTAALAAATPRGSVVEAAERDLKRPNVTLTAVGGALPYLEQNPRVAPEG